MKKLVLKPDDLRVDTFTTAGQPTGRGTVAAHYGTTHTVEGETCAATCDGADTCFVSCNMSECWQGDVCVVW